METSGSVNFPIVGIGASAGGLEAIAALLRALPPDTGLAFVVVQHLAAAHESMLADILARSTRMPVRTIEHGMLVEANRVYVIPPNSDLLLSQRALRLTPREAGAGLHLPIDGFFRSLAENQKNKAIALILSGTGSDGALGLEAIKAEGGISFAQDAESAKFAEMPRNAVATGCVDFVLDPAEIARELERIGQHSYIIGSDTAATEDSDGQVAEDFSQLFKLLQQTTGVDFSMYRQTTIQRRIRRRQALHNLEALHDYLRLLQEDPAEIQALHQELLIKVTQFFRDPETFEALKSLVFPQLLRNRPAKQPLRLWAPGCSTGEEAYSLAICMLEFLEQNRSDVPVQIFASDVNLAVIERARTGSYLENIAADLSPERLRRFFTRAGHGYRINKEIRDLCIFAPQDLIKDPPYSKLDLISCRNVLIYMGSIQQRVIPIFHYALNPAGFLLLGSSESAGSFADLFNAVDKKYKIYSKREGPGRRLLHYTPSRKEPAGKGGRRPVEGIGSSPDSRRVADRLVLDKYGPARVIIDDHLEVIEIGGDVRPYLEIAPGPASLNVLKIARGTALPVALHATVEKAKNEGAPARRERIRIERSGEFSDVNVEVIPLSSEHRRTFLVLFDQLPPAAAEPGQPDAGEETLSPELRAVRERDLQILHLKEELAQTRQYLLSAIEEHVISGEEAQSTEEESQSNIEELQSLNEELETAKEELQSANEELGTINEELQTRNVEITESRNFARSIVETVRQPLLVLDAELRIKTANQSFYHLFQASPGNTEGQSLYQMEGGRWNIPDLRTLIGEVLPSNKSFHDLELECEFPKIGRKILRFNARQLDRMQMILLGVEDITARKEAERALQKSEERLRHAQKMEAIGRLAGGVAHDFNNLLTSILGNTGMLLDEVGPDDPQRVGLEEIKKCGDRAASLTHQLLAFSRRQMLQPKVLTLNAVVADMEPMLRRLIGEHIELVIASDEALGPVRADPGQIGQIIMNLTLNARDAMLHGGTLTIESRNVDLDKGAAAQMDLIPGRFVMLAVSDTGIGMNPDTLERLFEPFFTTKGKGLGTGLGLATVFGIVEQSGAKIRVASALGSGASFKIFFPRIAESTEKPERLPGSLDEAPRGSEVVLLVEDEDAVRRVIYTFLETKGYKVLEAKHGGEGLALCKDYQGPIHLLLTDIVMPQVGGRELVEKGAPLRQEMKVLLMSGYTGELSREERILSIPFLQKPFTLQELALKVREVLDSKEASPPEKGISSRGSN